MSCYDKLKIIWLENVNMVTKLAVECFDILEI